MRRVLVYCLLLALATAPTMAPFTAADDEDPPEGPNPYEPCVRVDLAGGGYYLHPPGCVPDPPPG